jgi:hypothetical protein
MQPVLACDADARQLHDASSVLSQRSARPDGSRSTAVVPISVENGQIIVDVTIDGRGPFPMMFDTGGVEAVTPEAAAALGLKVEGGAAAVGRVQTRVTLSWSELIGDTWLPLFFWNEHRHEFIPFGRGQPVKRCSQGPRNFIAGTCQ